MSITKRTEVDQITCAPVDGTVLWREATVIEEDGVELIRTFKRSSKMADEGTSGAPAAVLPYLSMNQTPENIQKAKDKRTKK